VGQSLCWSGRRARIVTARIDTYRPSPAIRSPAAELLVGFQGAIASMLPRSPAALPGENMYFQFLMPIRLVRRIREPAPFFFRFAARMEGEIISKLNKDINIALASS
jgi:hypothetical protein